MSFDVDIYSIRQPMVGGSGRGKLMLEFVERLSSANLASRLVKFEGAAPTPLDLVVAGFRWAGGVAGGVLPLQSILALRGNFDWPEVASRIAFIDGVRLISVSRVLLKRGQRVVLDFDDLMSRRASRMLRLRENVAFGAFSGKIPKWAQAFISVNAVKLLRLEKFLLRKAEIEAAKNVDVIVFTSEYERRLFSRYLRFFKVTQRAELITLGPVYSKVKEPSKSESEMRFIFIGTDKLHQNKIAIEALDNLANSGRLPFKVFIYGEMEDERSSSDHIQYVGFAESLDEVYTAGSIMLIPRSVRGGIKTKVIEAFANGVPVIACSSAFEGFSPGYIWDGALDHLLNEDFERIAADYGEAVRSGQLLCAESFPAERYERLVREKF